MATADQHETSPGPREDELTRDPGRAAEDRGAERSRELPNSAVQWQDLEARWKAIVGIEASVETLRIGMEGLVGEIESGMRKSLTMEEKTYALRSDVAQWERAKSRVHYALPKMREFIHRAVWSLGAPERKRLGELYKDHVQTQIPFPQIDDVLKQLEDLQKDRQILAGLGKNVYQECKGIAAELQGAMKTLQNNARTRSKRNPPGSKRSFK